MRRQCELLGLNRSSLYYEPATETAANLQLMRRIDAEYAAHPFYGSRKMTRWLQAQGKEVNCKRVQRLMRVMEPEAIYPKPKLSVAGRGHRIFPYLLRDVRIERADQVWSTDITYIPLATGFMYLAAVIDWYSRYVVSWRLSNTREGTFGLEMLDEAFTAALAKHFARLAAKHLPSWEIIDYAHAEKPDAPSGTTRELAEALGEVAQNKLAVPVEKTHGPREARGASIAGTQVHSIRLPGIVLAFETIFGLPNERLTIRHDAGKGAEPYVHGTLLAVRRVMQVAGLVHGLDRLLFGD